MVAFDPERRWLLQGICNEVEEAERLFFAGGSNQVDRPPGPKTQIAWNQAKEICAVCPVIEECRRDTLGEEFGVWGGMDQRERWRARRKLAITAKQWPQAERLEWGEILANLREAGMGFGGIYRRTGVGPALAEELIKEWEATQQEPEPAPAVVDLPLPELGHRRDLPFPARAGQCHAWARHNGMITDAWYLGQTGDGKWIYVQTWVGRGRSVCKWLSAENVKVYHPQPITIRNYRSRPDVHDLTA